MLSPAEQIIQQRKRSREAKVTCYGVTKTFASTSKAINFYMLAVNGCDPQSSECARYNNILRQLYGGRRIVSDEG